MALMDNSGCEPFVMINQTVGVLGVHVTTELHQHCSNGCIVAWSDFFRLKRTFGGELSVILAVLPEI